MGRALEERQINHRIINRNEFNVVKLSYGVTGYFRTKHRLFNQLAAGATTAKEVEQRIIARAAMAPPATMRRQAAKAAAASGQKSIGGKAIAATVDRSSVHTVIIGSIDADGSDGDSEAPARGGATSP